MSERATQRRSNRRPARAKGTPAHGTPRWRASNLKVVPESRAVRVALRAHSIEAAARLVKSELPSKGQMQALARQILDQRGYPRGYVGWTMVALASAFWRDQVAAVPPARRLLLLPHCLKDATDCPAEYHEFGMQCKACGGCGIANFRRAAERLGYRVLVAEGSPVVLKIIINGYVDAIVGVACLNVLERALDKILLSGIPCMAVPLLSSDCRSTSVDEDWVQEMIHVRPGVSVVQTGTYLHLMRFAGEMFQPAELRRLIPAQHGQQSGRHGPGGLDPVAATAALARRFLARGGKHLRPFITLAAYDAVTGGTGTRPGGPQHLATLPDAVRCTALSIETFHKASLVHDDIEDDDAYRYGVPTLHREYGVPTAINVGDYLIGLGYRLVSHQRRALGLETAADLLDRLAAAHMQLCEGQGAELSWRDARNKLLTPADALRIYALKTAPAFEVALYAGLRLAGPVDPYLDTIRRLARSLGIAFQILNDLDDWHGDADNKVRIGADVVGRRPTVLWAMATESLGATGRQQLAALVTTHDRRMVQQVRQLYLDAGVFEKAQRLVDKYRARAEQLVEGMGPGPLQRLFRYLVETVLDPPTNSARPGIPAPSSRGLPLVV